MDNKEIIALAKAEFDKHYVKSNSEELGLIALASWIKAFDIAWRMSRENLSNMVMSDGDIFEVCKNEYINEHSSMKHAYMNNYLKGAKMQRDYWNGLIKSDAKNEK